MTRTRRIADSGRGGSPPVAAALQLTPADFERLARFITDRWGINLPPNKKLLLEGRLRKRVLALGLPGFGAYCDYLFSPEGLRCEPALMIDLVTTNKTEFFREADHFTYLIESVANHRAATATAAQPARPLTVWSAACATGEEPYTLAMVLSECAQANPGFRFGILATDISARALETARQGIYPESRADDIPLALRRRYLLRSKDRERPLVRFIPRLRAAIRFHRLNLLEIETRVRQQFDVIFCRNVLIYFDRPTQDQVLWQLYDRLAPDGYLFLGHAEALTASPVPLVAVAPTVYRRSPAGSAHAAATAGRRLASAAHQQASAPAIAAAADGRSGAGIDLAGVVR